MDESLNEKGKPRGAVARERARNGVKFFPAAEFIHLWTFSDWLMLEISRHGLSQITSPTRREFSENY